jgi:hypothetical protein
MKLTITLAASLAVMSVANGALYTLNNGTGSTASGVQTSDGKVFRSGTTDGQILGSAPQNKGSTKKGKEDRCYAKKTNIEWPNPEIK